MTRGETITVATCQLPDIQGRPQDSLAHIRQSLTWADSHNVDLICFPEGYLQGYTRDEAAAQQRAMTLSGSEFTSISRELADYRATFVLGVIERAGKRLYNTAAVLQNGHLLGAYRKTHPNEGIFTRGEDYPVFAASQAWFGINICNDANYPEAAQKLADQGTSVIMYPLNNVLPHITAEKWRERHIQNLIDRATQTKCWVVSADVVAKSDAEIGYGFAAIVEPNGTVHGRVGDFETGIITATIPL